MKSVGYWSPEDPPDYQNMLVYILEHPSRHEAEKNWAAFQADPEWKNKSRIREEWSAGRPHRPVFYGSDNLFTAQVGDRCRSSGSRAAVI